MKTLSFNPRVVLRHFDKKLDCPECGHSFKPTQVKRGRTTHQKRSQDQEDRAAKRYGARTQPGSGSRPGTKGDLRKRGVLRGECKETTAKSYTLKLAELLKLQREASTDELPLFEIEFQGVHPYQRFIILPDNAFVAMTERQESLEKCVAGLRIELEELRTQSEEG